MAAAAKLNNSCSSVASAFSGSIKPISDNPKFTESLQEELRSRLLLIKQALQKQQDDCEFLRI